MQSKTFRKYLLIILLISVALGILIHFDKIMDAFIPAERNFRDGHGPRESGILNSVSDVFISSMVAFLAFLINYYIIRPFDSHIRLDLKRISVAVAITLVSITILSELLFSLMHIVAHNDEHHKFIALYTFRDFFIATIVMTGVSFIKIINDRQAIKVENEKLRAESLQSQFEALKNQVSPHFLFNSLTALNVLIGDSPDLAKQYVSHLSQVLRYTIQSARKQVVTLIEELDFFESYLFLLKIRYDTNLTVKSEIANEFKFYKLPPLTVQTLIENAVKHNEISDEFPFEIRICTTENQTLKVINKIQKKITPEEGIGIGLSNLSRLFLLLGEKDIQIFRDEHEFTVEVPLIKS